MPTQIGNTPVPCVSLRTTTGMLVTGSIIKPRILTSSSMLPPGDSEQVLADQTIRARARDYDLNVFSQKILARRSEIYHAICSGASSPLIAGRVMRVNENLERLADERFVARDLNLPLTILKNREPPSLLVFGDGIAH